VKRVVAGVVATLAAETFLGVAVLYLGLAPVAADQTPSALEARILGVALRKAVLQRTSGEPEPPPPSHEDLASGGEIYKEMCSRCHGEPGAVSSPLGSSFYPPAPLLPGHGSEWSERELFWIIKHGIRNTAMPAWAALLADDDIRQVAALVKRFDKAPVAGHADEATH
jgi:mono/diheme cytochrome c family protein